MSDLEAERTFSALCQITKYFIEHSCGRTCHAHMTLKALHNSLQQYREPHSLSPGVDINGSGEESLNCLHISSLNSIMELCSSLREKEQ